MGEVKDIELYQRAIKRWGAPAQRRQAIEECSELIKAICKYERKPTLNSNYFADCFLIEEMVDVQLMINQLRVMVNDELQWDRWMASKTERLKELLKE